MKTKDNLFEQSGSFFYKSTAHPEERSDEGSHEILQPFGLQDDPSARNNQKNSARGHLFIFLTIVLIILFIASIVENITILSKIDGRLTGVRVQEGPHSNAQVSETLKRLEEEGLKLREAEYYKVINE